MPTKVGAAVAVLGFCLAGSMGALAAGQELAVEKVNADQVLLFDSAEGPKSGAIARADFPTRVTLLEPQESDMGRLHLQLPDGRAVWVLGRHVSLVGQDKRQLVCDTTLAAAPTLGVRGGMERCRK